MILINTKMFQYGPKLTFGASLKYAFAHPHVEKPALQ